MLQNIFERVSGIVIGAFIVGYLVFYGIIPQNPREGSIPQYQQEIEPKEDMEQDCTVTNIHPQSDLNIRRQDGIVIGTLIHSEEAIALRRNHQDWVEIETPIGNGWVLDDGVLGGDCKNEIQLTNIIIPYPNEPENITEQIISNEEQQVNSEVLEVQKAVEPTPQVRIETETQDEETPCKDGGWEELGYRNQGECQSEYVQNR